MESTEHAIKEGLEDGFKGNPRKPSFFVADAIKDHDIIEDYLWAYRMGVLKKLNENPLEQMVITRTNECETCNKKGRYGCPWFNARVSSRRSPKDDNPAFILLCTEWEAME